jgi:integrase
VYYSRGLKRQLRLLHRQQGRPKTGPIYQGKAKWGRHSRRDLAITTRTGERWVADIGRSCRCGDIEAHDLRRLFATNYFECSRSVAGDLAGLQLMLGHKNPKTSLIYVLGRLGRMAGILEKMTRQRIRAKIGATGAPGKPKAGRSRGRPGCQ